MCDVSRAAEGIRLLPWPVSAAYSGSLRIKHSGPYTIIFTACKLLSVVRQKRLFTCSVCDRYSKAGLTMPGLFLVSFSCIPWFISGQYWFCCISPYQRVCISTGTALCIWYYIRKGDGLCKVQVFLRSNWQKQSKAVKLSDMASWDCFCFSFF